MGHLQEDGFKTDVINVQNMAVVKARYEIHPDLAACHTAEVDGYTIEGHVPPDVIRRLLREKPDIAGLAVPGMPMGSPGMEVMGGPFQPYDVIAFDHEGGRSIYETINEKH
ncbi:MAG: DUF411 domain-containing protein [Gemmatimonadota bacterium]